MTDEMTHEEFDRSLEPRERVQPEDPEPDPVPTPTRDDVPTKEDQDE